jgi:hypothetical protein
VVPSLRDSVVPADLTPVPSWALICRPGGLIGLQSYDGCESQNFR